MFEGLFQPMHLLVIFGIALLVFGPKKLPELGKGIGEGIRGFKAAIQDKDEEKAAISDAAAGVSAQREDAFGALVFSVKVAEYVGLGLPVVCSGTATMRHYFDDDEMLFFEPDDPQDLARAISDLLTDTAAADELARKSQLKLDKLRWSAQKQALVETVEKLGAG